MNLFDDRRALRSLRVGVVPSSHVLQLCVGVSPLIEVLDRQIAKASHLKSAPFVINGEWGTGKSNLLSYIREYALKRNMAVAYLTLNGRSTPINHPERYYHRIASDLRLPGSKGRGIASMIKAVEASDSLKKSAMQWVNLNLLNSELAQSVSLYFIDGAQWALQIISGMDLYRAGYEYKKQKAMRRLNDLGGFLAALGYNGLMVQFDELEMINQLWNIASRRSAYKHLHDLLHLKHILPVFAATDRLNEVLKRDINSGKLYGDSSRFVQEYLNLTVIKPPVVSLSLGRELSNRLERLYRTVYKVSNATNVQSEVVEHWWNMAFNNPRRLIRLTIDHLDRHRI
jgi:BREX system ATP-binding protein BrxC/D